MIPVRFLLLLGAVLFLFGLVVNVCAAPTRTCMFPGEKVMLLANGQLWCAKPLAVKRVGKVKARKAKFHVKQV